MHLIQFYSHCLLKKNLSHIHIRPNVGNTLIIAAYTYCLPPYSSYFLPLLCSLNRSNDHYSLHFVLHDLSVALSSQSPLRNLKRLRVETIIIEKNRNFLQKFLHHLGSPFLSGTSGSSARHDGGGDSQH